MLLKQTIVQLHDLKLNGMAMALERQFSEPKLHNLPFDERIAHLVDAEVHDRAEKKKVRLLRQARLKAPSACLENLHYSKRSGIDRSQIADLGQCHWVDKHQNLLINGSTGIGKTWLLCAFGQAAIRQGKSVLYYRVNRLLEEAEIARADGSLPQLRKKLGRVGLLLLDDFGLAPLTDLGRQDLLEFIDDRIGTGSVIIASQLPIESWYSYINEPTMADAILDRIVHRSHKIQISGESMRKQLGMNQEGK